MAEGPLKMFQNYISEKVLFKKCHFRLFFNQKVRASTSLWWYFCVFQPAWGHIWLPGNQQECDKGGGLSGSPPCFLLAAQESYMTPSHTAMHFFIAIQIRVKCCGAGHFYFILKECRLGICSDCLIASKPDILNSCTNISRFCKFFDR